MKTYREFLAEGPIDTFYVNKLKETLPKIGLFFNSPDEVNLMFAKPTKKKQ